MSNEKNKVSFDFDGTLSKEKVQNYARKLISLGFDVHITTTRIDFGYGAKFDNSDLFKVADRLGIKRENIFFTCARYKCNFLNDNFLFHLDDDEYEIAKITNIKAINVNRSGWIDKCNKAIEDGK